MRRRSTDPSEYASLSHPGDSFSYDMFSQAGQAVRDHAATILGGLHPRKLIAAGESQSAIRLMTYIDAVQPDRQRVRRVSRPQPVRHRRSALPVTATPVFDPDPDDDPE